MNKVKFGKKKHDHLVLEFNNNLKLIYNDVRKFGYIQLAEKPFDIFNLKNLGFEPFIATNFRDILFAKIKRRKASIKDILLDQSFICGVGNIYASEILHKAKISPFKKGIKFYKNDFLISKAEFFKNSELEYIFHNVRFSKDTLDIEKAEHIKEKKVQYIISNTTISNMNIKKSTLKIKNNNFVI